ncbi:hypothetical protein [Niallia sp. NCCP-28]|uniref:hypothetical protein n=1 Tax=Niallia sp. NCCP-28 TaxID=2934712 RepID=UPI00207F2862|nr:hypothetical protein [Niallia sp. NCCP-28]GKU83814.1 hypothetical protein NCCP28_32100 [Niallia sp. NCCP-28]
MKKLFAALLTFTIMFSPLGSVIVQDQIKTVEAKSYKSGKKSFNQSNSNTNNSNANSFFQKKKSNDTKTATKSNKGFFSGGLMKGLMVGGLAGLLFGSLFANMGILGSILGFMINVFAIILLIGIIRKIFAYFKNKKKEEANPWRN